MRLEAPPARIPVLVRAGSVIPVENGDGGLELQVWPPEAGRTGGGLLVTDAGNGWDEPVVQRFVVRLAGEQVAVERVGAAEVGYPVRVCGGG